MKKTKFIHTQDFATATRLTNQGLQLVMHSDGKWTFIDDQSSTLTFSREDKFIKSNTLYM